MEVGLEINGGEVTVHGNSEGSFLIHSPDPRFCPAVCWAHGVDVDIVFLVQVCVRVLSTFSVWEELVEPLLFLLSLYYSCLFKNRLSRCFRPVGRRVSQPAGVEGVAFVLCPVVLCC